MVVKDSTIQRDFLSHLPAIKSFEKLLLEAMFSGFHSYFCNQTFSAIFLMTNKNNKKVA
jgi:hypothetical protein